MKTAFLLFSTAIVALAAPPVHAQTAETTAATDEAAPPAENAAADADNSYGEILVTAQRRSESIQNVPIAISAFNAEMVEGSGSTNITSLNGLAPNVVLQTQGLVANVPMISIRGMSTSDPDPNADPKVSTIIDGVYIPFVSSTMLDLFDIERVEVLKGPQGVLFGKNNLAGTINVSFQTSIVRDQRLAALFRECFEDDLLRNCAMSAQESLRYVEEAVVRLERLV